MLDTKLRALPERVLHEAPQHPRIEEELERRWDERFELERELEDWEYIPWDEDV